MPPCRISIITPTLNQAPFLKDTINSVLSQTGDFALEYLICDGGSTDGTLDILAQHTPRIRLISERDAGPADAVNRGLARAQGDIVGWINSDDLLCAGALQRVAERFQANPDLEWLHGRCAIIDANGVPRKSWISRYKDHSARRFSYARLLTENFISQMTVFWRRSVLTQVGTLDSSLQYAYDYDLWLRLARRQAPGFIDERQACFRWYPASRGRSNFGPQLREDWQVAKRYANGHAWSIRLKALKSARTYAVYAALGFFERKS